MVSRCYALASLLLALPAQERAQPPAELPSFEVASVRQSHYGNGNREQLRIDPGGLSLTDASLSFCIRWAYNVRPDQLSGPDWLRTKFDIVAKTSAASTEGEMRRMMQTLLAERFKLVLHRETRQLDVYEMRIAKHGPKLTKADSEESGELDVKDREGFYAFRHVTMAEFAQQIRIALDHPVVDRTGIEGRYDLTLRFPAGYRPTPHGLGEMPPVMDLVEKQLGLTLELKKLPTEVLAIDQGVKLPIGN